MKTSRTISIAFLTIFAAAATVTAQVPDDPAEADLKNTPMTKILPLPKADKPAAKKKKKAKKPAPKPVSEYKFERIDHMPAYTFDKQTNPIIKGVKPKKKAVKSKKAAAKPAPKLKAPLPADGQEDGKLQFPEGDDQQPPQDQQEE